MRGKSVPFRTDKATRNNMLSIATLARRPAGVLQQKLDFAAPSG